MICCFFLIWEFGAKLSNMVREEHISTLLQGITTHPYWYRIPTIECCTNRIGTVKTAMINGDFGKLNTIVITLITIESV